MQTDRSRTLTVLAALGGAMSMVVGAAQGVLYDLDFSTPPHIVNALPTTGGGPPPRDTVSAIVFGTPRVRASIGNLTNQPLEFDSFDNQGDQIRLLLSDLPPSNFYRLDCQIELGNMAPGSRFVFVFDTPQVRTINFLANGDVTIFVPGVTSMTIGTVGFGVIIDLRVDIDLVADTWDISLNGTPAHSGPFGGATQLTAVRISTDVIANPPGAFVAIDNLVITETTAPACPEDVNNDGRVDVLDLLALLSAWGPYTPCPPFIKEDINQDCRVDVLDLLALLAAWGPC